MQWESRRATQSEGRGSVPDCWAEDVEDSVDEQRGQEQATDSDVLSHT